MCRVARQFWWGMGRYQGDLAETSGRLRGEFRLKSITFPGKVHKIFKKVHKNLENLMDF